MTDYIQKAKEKAALELVKAERIQRVVNNLPDIGLDFLPIVQSKSIWIVYRAKQWDDILTVMDSFPIVPMIDCKTPEGYRGTYWEDEGEVLGEYVAKFRVEGSIEIPAYADLVVFCMIAGERVEVHLKFESSRFSETPWDKDLSPVFRDLGHGKGFAKMGAPALARFGTVVSFNTYDSPQKPSYDGCALISDREELFYMVEDFKGREKE